jgi:hypothetical protein
MEHRGRNKAGTADFDACRRRAACPGFESELLILQA